MRRPIRLKRVYEPTAKEDGRRVLVDRLWPRGLRKDESGIDEWSKEIAPSDELRKWFAHDPLKWKEFRQRYIRELEEKREAVERLRAMASKGTVTLLFAATDSEHNNAVVLKEAIEKGL